MTRQEREILWNGRGSWDIKTQQLYDKTYHKVYCKKMNLFRKPLKENSDFIILRMHETDALIDATITAENAVNEYLTKTNEII